MRVTDIEFTVNTGKWYCIYKGFAEKIMDVYEIHVADCFLNLREQRGFAKLKVNSWWIYGNYNGSVENSLDNEFTVIPYKRDYGSKVNYSICEKRDLLWICEMNNAFIINALDK